MSTPQLIRIGGAAAVLAGGLRIVTALWAFPDPSLAIEWLYLAIDLLILFGVFALYASLHERVGVLGFIGFVLAVAGAAIITGPDGRLGALDVYSAGSLCIGLGLVCLAAASWRAHALPRWVAGFWVCSTAAGILGAATGSRSLFTAAGVAFGAALVGAGHRMWRASAEPQPYAAPGPERLG